jgi:hypothetical protein
MTIVSRNQVPLEDVEICLVKGLLKHRRLLKINQQRVIAYFSFPHRTVHHNVISAIARNVAGLSDSQYPPADLAACRRFMDSWNGNWGEHLWATFTSALAVSQRQNFDFGYRFHPVGQGLFSSGHLSRSGQPAFNWVYDCGTEMGSRVAARGQHVRDEIAQLKSDVETDRLDLVTLSHFDEDHLSGMLDLLATFRVGVLLLPYLSPWERLIVALSEKAVAGSDLLAFLMTPTAFLLERAEGRIEQILLVPPNDDGGEALPPAISPDAPVRGEELGTFPLVSIKDHAPDGEGENEGVPADAGLSDPRVRVLHRGGYILVDRAWEFVPYNDCRLEALATKDFKDAARPLARQLIRAAKEADREAALVKLTELYDETFKFRGAKKISPRRRNEISLFLYSGPIGQVELCSAVVTIPRHRMGPNVGEIPRFWIHTDRFGQMLTGDGFLHTPKQFHDFQRFYNVGNRISRGAIFQVMHHGSQANWKMGLAGEVKPVASIFCSDPLGKNAHPHAPVLADFVGYHPVQIDGEHGWQLIGTYRFL